MEPGALAWVLTSSALVLFMTPGLAFFYGGMDRSRNVLNMLMINFYCLLIVPVLWMIAGYSLAQVPFDNDFLGTFDAFFLKDIGIIGDNGGTIAITKVRGALVKPSQLRARVTSVRRATGAAAMYFVAASKYGLSTAAITAGLA